MGVIFVIRNKQLSADPAKGPGSDAFEGSVTSGLEARVEVVNPARGVNPTFCTNHCADKLGDVLWVSGKQVSDRTMTPACACLIEVMVSDGLRTTGRLRARHP
jgi:hypothetical protein